MKKYTLCWAVIGLFLLTACQSEKPVQKTRLRSVKFQQIQSLSESTSRTFSGVAKGGQEANLSFKIAGTLASLPVKVGTQLKNNQLIARLDNSQYSLQIQQAQATLAQARANQRNSLAAFERMKGLYENNNASRNDLDAARANSDSNRAQVNAAYKSLELARLNLSYTQLKSTGDCDVAEVNVEKNENINSGQGIVKVSCGQQMNVEIAVPGRYVSAIKTGMSADVIFSTLEGSRFTATVSEVSVSSQGGATFPVTLVLDDIPESLRSGMVAEVSFNFVQQDRNNQRIVVPAIAVSEDIQGRFVYIVEPQQNDKADAKKIAVVKRQAVKVGDLTSDGLEILAGLKPRDRVVTAGITVIRDGLKVRLN